MYIEQIGTQIAFDDPFNLKLESKKLSSGKCQVKFFASFHKKKPFYGYLLVDSACSLKDVVHRIREKLTFIECQRDYQQTHLYSIGKMAGLDMNFIIFDQ
ncbi:MAG: hypothetical protein HQ474_00890 [Flammeovirgaceae bacterium]|jgi:hypothetical protein|nr:hypothetical protein [Flammeovirgaceae bacterium]|tara:strand:+ start:18014 stop:18313 length:300 start_codon:yes stop_codon:yes gene_type:complete